MTAGSELLPMPPAFVCVPGATRTIGPTVRKLFVGVENQDLVDDDPHQSWLVDRIFDRRTNEQGVEVPAAFEVAMIAARQNLKTTTIIKVVLGWLAIEQVQTVIWTAQEMPVALETASRLHQALKDCPATAHLIPDTLNEGLYTANGQSRIELTSGQRVLVRARSAAGSRGLSGVERIIMDEAFALSGAMMGALVPTMQTKPNAQILFGSSAGLRRSDALRTLRDRGRPGTDPKLLYAEWCWSPEPCADEDCAHARDAVGCAYDRAELALPANPAAALDPPRINREAIERSRRSMPPEEFAREVLGVWDDPPADEVALGDLIVDWDVWNEAFTEAEPPREGMALAIRRSKDLTSLSLAMAVKWPDGRVHVAAVAYSPALRQVLAQAARIQGSTGCKVMVDVKDPGGNTAKLAKTAGVKLTEVDLDELAEGQSDLLLALAEGQLTHFGDALDEAMLRARLRNAGSRRVFSGFKNGDVSMLEAAALAYHQVTRKAKTYVS